LYSALIEIESCLAKVSYNFTTKDNFSHLKSIEETQLIYWSEIVQRLHVFGATTILRLKNGTTPLIVITKVKIITVFVLL